MRNTSSTVFQPKSIKKYRKRSWALLLLALTVLLSAAACNTVKPVADAQSNAISRANLTLQEENGFKVYTRNCAPCHLLTLDDVKVGPSLYGIADSGAERVPGQDARTYILTSILRPSSFVVQDFQDIMPQGLAKSLTSEELDAVVAYLLTLENQ